MAKTIWAPVMRSHRLMVDQIALLEPGLAETVCASLLDIMREAMDEVVRRGVPPEAARDFLLGHMNILAVDERGRLADRALVTRNGACGDGRSLGVRPEDVELEPAGSEGENRFPAKVAAIRFLGAHSRVELDLGAGTVTAVCFGEPTVAPGAEVTLRGRGAGGPETATAIVRDLIDIWNVMGTHA